MTQNIAQSTPKTHHRNLRLGGPSGLAKALGLRDLERNGRGPGKNCVLGFGFIRPFLKIMILKFRGRLVRITPEGTII